MYSRNRELKGCSRETFQLLMRIEWSGEAMTGSIASISMPCENIGLPPHSRLLLAIPESRGS